MRFLKIYLSLFFIISSFVSLAQVQRADSSQEFEIIRGPSMRSIKIDSLTTLQTIAGGAIIKQKGTIFKSDSLAINPVTHIVEAFGNVEINQGDTLFTYGQYLKYLGIEKMAYMKKNVKLTDKKSTLFTQDLDYNLGSGIGNFYNGGKVIEGKNIITSVNGTYYADTKDVYFKKDVKADGPKNKIRADSLLYNMQTKIANFISRTNIKNADVEINTTQGSYDLNTNNAFFTSRTTVKDSSGRLYVANNMALEDKTGNAQMEGNAVVIDTANNFVLLANQIFLNKKNNSFLATRKPVLILKQKDDSTYIAADTIYSGINLKVEANDRTIINDSSAGKSMVQSKLINKIAVNDSADLRKRITIDYLLKKSDTLHMVEEKSIIDTLRKFKPLNIKEDSIKIKSRPPGLLIGKDTLTRKDSTIKKDTSMKISKRQDSLNIKSTHPDLLIEKETVSRKDSTIKKDTIVKISSRQDSLKLKLSNDSSIRYFIAFHHVRVFNDSMQSVCDSLFLSTKDSVFRLYKDPVVWSGHSQVTGDTIFLFTKDKQPSRFYAFDNSMVINRTYEGFYNQVTGKTTNGYFIDGKIDYARVRGSQAESIWYMQNDDSAYVGMNRAAGDVLDLYFRKQELKKVLYINDIKGNLYPMKQIPADQKELKGFQWLDSRRPKNKLELFE
ncbi:MAG: OstA-like protein [Ginsengibacter sp.]